MRLGNHLCSQQLRKTFLVTYSVAERPNRNFQCHKQGVIKYARNYRQDIAAMDHAYCAHHSVVSLAFGSLPWRDISDPYRTHTNAYSFSRLESKPT